jgi:hypothetical protein
VKPEQLFVVVLTDYTKHGTLTTNMLNKHTALMTKCMAKNPKRTSSELCSVFLHVTSFHLFSLVSWLGFAPNCIPG